ncbi:hypothetical protein EVAR_4019_1 [Eumeta japonica]|uniref:Uncharacterized protein n=1 Tax=Eumeta variegata TaxID=151549 RepID=A0A4C1T6R9_EUMVA|nr:hypothetical protein EVAR_4019_1 [Eumeta japonica]
MVSLHKTSLSSTKMSSRTARGRRPRIRHGRGPRAVFLPRGFLSLERAACVTPVAFVRGPRRFHSSPYEHPAIYRVRFDSHRCPQPALLPQRRRPPRR